MKTTARFLLTASAAALLSIPASAAVAQDCVIDGPGSSAGTPEQCEIAPTTIPTETEVKGVQVGRDDNPAPEPEAAPTLAATGASTTELALAAALALGAGGTMVMAGRRSRVEA